MLFFLRQDIDLIWEYWYFLASEPAEIQVNSHNRPFGSQF